MPTEYAQETPRPLNVTQEIGIEGAETLPLEDSAPFKVDANFPPFHDGETSVSSLDGITGRQAQLSLTASSPIVGAKRRREDAFLTGTENGDDLSPRRRALTISVPSLSATPAAFFKPSQELAATEDNHTFLTNKRIGTIKPGCLSSEEQRKISAEFQAALLKRAQEKDWAPYLLFLDKMKIKGNYPINEWTPHLLGVNFISTEINPVDFTIALRELNKFGKIPNAIFIKEGEKIYLKREFKPEDKFARENFSNNYANKSKTCPYAVTYDDENNLSAKVASTNHFMATSFADKAVNVGDAICNFGNAIVADTEVRIEVLDYTITNKSGGYHPRLYGCDVKLMAQEPNESDIGSFGPNTYCVFSHDDQWKIKRYFKTQNTVNGEEKTQLKMATFSPSDIENLTDLLSDTNYQTLQSDASKWEQIVSHITEFDNPDHAHIYTSDLKDASSMEKLYDHFLETLQKADLNPEKFVCLEESIFYPIYLKRQQEKAEAEQTPRMGLGN